MVAPIATSFIVSLRAPRDERLVANLGAERNAAATPSILNAAAEASPMGPRRPPSSQLADKLSSNAITRGLTVRPAGAAVQTHRPVKYRSKSRDIPASDAIEGISVSTGSATIDLILQQAGVCDERRTST